MTPEERVEEIERAIHQPLIAYLNDKISLFEATEQILNLKDDKGYMLGIISEDQSLPYYNFNNTPTFFESGYNIAQSDMLRENWFKLIRRDE